jgi:pyrroloquinoline quinone (PQQ) biosynthesis protein C
VSTLANRRYLLSPICRIQSSERSVIVTCNEEEILIDTSFQPQISELLTALRTSNCPADFLVKQGITQINMLDPALQALLESDLLLDVDRACEATCRHELNDALQAEARFWAKPIFEQPFWEQLLSGQCSPSQILGWGVEFYHFVDAANDYMPLGVSHTRELRQLRGPIASHYIEEMNHGKIFLEGLARCGLQHESVLVAPPLPHTRALINQLIEYAYEGELAYTSSFAIMQSGLTQPSIAVLDEFYGRLKAYYPYAAGLFDAFHRHASLDVELGHEKTVFMRLCLEGPLLAPVQIRRASTVMRSLAESFMLFFDGINKYYGTTEGFTPRRALQLEGLV